MHKAGARRIAFSIGVPGLDAPVFTHPTSYPFQTMKLGLRIDVSDARGAREGAPRLLDLFRAARATATFFFNVGPAHLFGVPWLPGTDLGRQCAELIQRVRDAGCEAALLAFDGACWAARAARGDADWTRRAMERGCERFTEIARTAPTVHGAAGWQMNRHAFRLTQRLGFYYASDTRGTGPFVPVCDGELVACPQLPTTLPTFPECLAVEGDNIEDAMARLLARSAAPVAAGHVYSANAGIEGVKWAATFERLLAGLREQGHEPVALAAYADGIDVAHLPRHVVVPGTIDGRRAPLALQGKEFLT